jgi:hypothetical protein
MGRQAGHIFDFDRQMKRFVIFALLIFAVVRGSFCAEPTEHWAFQTPRRPALPTIRDRSWPANAIDYFTLAKMEAHSLNPSARADRATLLRRVTLDLTDLPPSISELDRFGFATAPDAYDRQVSRLLDSPRFGERMAVVWLDAARFADTHGFLIDAHRDMWRWRDWVIEAFNRNMPFDQFTVEQLAGDLLPSPTLDQLIATGFNRNHMINYENGADENEYRMEYVADRAAATANVWLGLTFQCARCHDHKYDPLSQREFYQWFAFFNNVVEEGLDGNLGNAIPVIAAPTLEQQLQLNRIESQMAASESFLAKKRETNLVKMPTWERSLSVGAAPPIEAPVSVFHLGFDQPDQLAGIVNAKPVPFQVNGDVSLVDGRWNRAMLFDGRTYIDLDKIAWPNTAAGLTIAAWIFPTTPDEMVVISLQDGRQKSQLALALNNLRPTLKISAGGSLGKMSSAANEFVLRKWQHVAVVWDGTIGGRLQWFIDGIPTTSNRAESVSPLLPASTGKWRVGSDGDENGFRGILDEIGVFARELRQQEIAALANADPVQAALAVPMNNRSSEQLRLLCDTYLQRTDADYQRTFAELEDLKSKQAALRRTIPTTMVMRELPEPRDTFVLRRGRFDQPGDRVEPGTPSALLRFPEGLPRSRMGLAQWLVQPSNPLTARVMVNRIWQVLFGSGLVRTPEDFGLRGENPTHPELLDWLAVEFIESGWDIKHIVRLIVTSETYRQSSHIDSKLPEADPDNRWLARSPRLRLEAEGLRDSMLLVSGLLDQRIGGPSVFPYQPPGLWEEVSFNPNDFSAQKYVQSRGADLFRRSLYTFWKRTLPPPALAIFDAPTRETCIASRSRTNTPLQALVLMNETTSIESARHLAARAMREAASSSKTQLVFLFKLVTAREPTLGEQRELIGLFERQRERFRVDPEAARRLLSVGDSPQDSGLDPVDQAAWTIVANVLLCLDEFVTRG